MKWRKRPALGPANGPVMPADTARRALIICLAVMCVPIGICLMLYSTYSIHTMEREIYRNMQMTVEQGKNNIDYRMAQVEKNARSILSTIYPYLNSTVDASEQLEEYAEMMRVFSEYRNQNMITKLRVYVPGDKIYSNQNDTFYSLEQLLSTETGLRITSGTVWQETHEITPSFGYASVPVISCVSAITSSSSYDRLVGVMFLDVDVRQFAETLSAGVEADNALFVVNESGEVLIHPDEAALGENPFAASEMADFTAAVGESGRIEMEGAQYLMVLTRLEAANWYLVMTVPERSIYASGTGSLDIVQMIIMLMIFATLVLALIITYNIVVRNTVQRINATIGATIDTMQCDGLESIEDEHEGTRDQRRTLAALEHNIGLLAVTITNLLESRYRDQIAVRDFQMQALQAQINPHFLYNTLDIIKWMIADGRNDDGIWMINALSRYFQLSLSNGRDIVGIGEEIRLTRTYVGIMQRRFQDVFSAEFDVEPDAEGCLIPKLSLQPVVENALLHGILYAEKRDKRICVRAMREEDRIIIDVEDNGSGIDPERLEEIRRAGTEGPAKSYGLSNVIRRLRLFGADDSVFEINSRVGVGTCVTLRFPVRLSEEPSGEDEGSA